MSEEREPITEHAYLRCDGAELFSRSEHCAICDLPPNDPIHKSAKDAPEVRAA